MQEAESNNLHKSIQTLDGEIKNVLEQAREQKLKNDLVEAYAISRKQSKLDAKNQNEQL